MEKTPSVNSPHTIVLNEIFQYLEGVSKGGVFVIFVKDRSYTAKHLQKEGFPVQDVKLLADIFDGGGDEVIGLVVGVNSEKVWHNEKVPVGRKDGLELVGSVDYCCHAIAEDAGVFGVKGQRPVDDVDKQLDVVRVGKVARHCLKHPGNQTDPVELVDHIQPIQLL